MKRNHYCSEGDRVSVLCAILRNPERPIKPQVWWIKMVTVKSSQKLFTDQEISRLTGICLDHLHGVARSKHLGSIVRAAEVAGEQADHWLFTHSDLNVLAALFPRCQH
jgi:hypothetical protein